MVKSVLLDALPYADAERLVRVVARFETAPDVGGSLSAGTVDDVSARQRSFSMVGASSSNGADAVLHTEHGAETIRLAWVQPAFFRTLGVNPALGRVFDETEVRDTARVVLLSHALWQQRFAGDADILGRTIQLNGLPCVVIGVMPREFLHPVRHSDVYMPLNLRPVLASPVSARGSHFLELFGRLAGCHIRCSAAGDRSARCSARGGVSARQQQHPTGHGAAAREHDG